MDYGCCISGSQELQLCSEILPYGILPIYSMAEYKNKWLRMKREGLFY